MEGTPWICKVDSVRMADSFLGITSLGARTSVDSRGYWRQLFHVELHALVAMHQAPTQFLNPLRITSINPTITRSHTTSGPRFDVSITTVL